MRMKKKNLWLYILCGIAAIVGISALSVLSARFDGEAAVRVNIPREATKESVRDSLTGSLGHKYGSLVYRLWSVASGDASASHGSYLVEPGASALVTANDIAKRHQTPVRVTINSMRTLDDLSRRLGSRLEATPAQFRAAIDSVVSLDSATVKSEHLPAAFIPDTYEFYWTDSPRKVMEKLLEARDAFWTPERLEKARKLGLTPVEVATVASIVEEESAKRDELPVIARLYMNRLNRGMKLQADPTVKYAIGDFSLRRITGKHLSVESPYNTYRNTGLPPGPIRIPNKTTIDAVLNAPSNNYIYMCAKEDFSGYHNFASDYATHERNAQRYRAALNRRGIYR